MIEHPGEVLEATLLLFQQDHIRTNPIPVPRRLVIQGINFTFLIFLFFFSFSRRLLALDLNRIVH